MRPKVVFSSIRNRRLGDIICDNTDLKRVSSNVFVDRGFLDVRCGSHNTLNIGLFY